MSAPPRVLVVDPEPRSREVLACFLGALGYRVATAADGNRALNIALEADLDLAIVESHLPVVDGPELLAMLRRRHLARPLRVIALGCWECPDVRAAFEVHRVDCVLMKPLDLSSLREALTRIVPSHAQLELSLYREAPQISSPPS